MPIKRINPLSDDDAFFGQYMTNIEHSIINELCYVGECCIAMARSVGSYTDRTGNLRNSIGYVVINNGKVVTQVASVEQTREFMQELIKDCHRGIYLIVVASMNYATYVSATGRDVLDSAELEAEKLMRQLGFVKR